MVLQVLASNLGIAEVDRILARCQHHEHQVEIDEKVVADGGRLMPEISDLYTGTNDVSFFDCYEVHNPASGYVTSMTCSLFCLLSPGPAGPHPSSMDHSLGCFSSYARPLALINKNQFGAPGLHGLARSGETASPGN